MEYDRTADIKERIRTMMQLDEAIAEGRMCKQFLESDIGQFILEHGIRIEDRAKEALVKVRRGDFDSTEGYLAKIAELQEDARVPQRLWLFVNEAIQLAEQAKIQIKEEERTADGDY